MFLHELTANNLRPCLKENNYNSSCWSQPLTAQEILAEAGISSDITNSDRPETVFRRCDSYLETYIKKIIPYQALRSKFRDFMELKRWNPQNVFNKSDSAFSSDAIYNKTVPGLRHAHITFDLSIIYKLTNNELWLYGFYSHDELGIGQPHNIRKQASMARYFANKNQTTCPVGVKRAKPKYK